LIKRLWGKRDDSIDSTDQLKLSDNMPEHIAIIMDGNGRWAKRRGLPRIAGHHSGMKTIKKITVAADRLGIKYLTLYAFSTENWKRPKDEVDYLMKLPQQFLTMEIDELMENNVQVRVMGLIDHLPVHTRTAVEEAMQRTANNTGLVLNFALNYGGRLELIEAVKHIAESVSKDELSLEQINDDLFSTYLQSKGIPDPDLLIRTSGEVRLSNFMLWQLAYSEFYFTEVHWPEFSEEHFIAAIQEYQRRARRFGGV